MSGTTPPDRGTTPPTPAGDTPEPAGTTPATHGTPPRDGSSRTTGSADSRAEKAKDAAADVKARAERTKDAATDDLKVRVERAKGTADDLKVRVQRAKGAADEVKGQWAQAADARRGGPVDSVEDAESKAADLRGAIERDLVALQARMPDTDELTDRAKKVAMAVGGGIVGLGIVLKARERRSVRRAHAEEVREYAEALARELARIDLATLDDEGAGRWPWFVALLAAVAGVGALTWQRSRTEDDGDDPGSDTALGRGEVTV